MTRALARRLPAALVFLAAAVATAGLWIVSRGKWSHPIVDSGREWIVPDSLARGEMLYQDIVYWFGPLTPYLHAFVFEIFGSSFRTLVAAGVAASAAILVLLYMALRTVTGRTEAALGVLLAIPLLLFMPSAGGSILGMGYRIWHAAAFTLAAVALAVTPSRSWARAAGIGGLCAAAGLCRLEWGLAAIGGVAVCVAVREGFRLSCLREILSAAVAFLLLCGGVLGAFVAVAGSDAVIGDGHVFLTGLPEETRRFLLNNSGFHDPRGGTLRLLYSAILWAGIFLVVEVAAAWGEDRGRLRRRLPWIAGIALYLFLYDEYGGSARLRLMSGAPLFGPVAVVAALRRPGKPGSGALAGFGALAFVLSYRKLFSIGDSAYVAPPLLFALVSGAGLLALLVASQHEAAARRRLRRGVRVVLACLILASFADRIALYASDGRAILPGTEGMLSARPETVRTLSLISENVRRRTAPHESLVVFPEGEVLNYLSKRRNPLRNRLYIPGYVTKDNEAAVLRELESFRPGALVILNRATAEYGRNFFGVDYARGIASWIRDNYIEVRFDPAAEKVPVESGARLFLRKR